MLLGRIREQPAPTMGSLSNPRDARGDEGSELHAQTSVAGLSKLHGRSAVGELESPGITPIPPQKEFAQDAPKQPVHGLGVTVEAKGGKR